MSEITGGVAPRRNDGEPGHAAAPFVYFDHAVTFGPLSGVIRVELVAHVIVPERDGTRPETVWAAHLRCSPAAAASLRDALNGALEALQQQIQQALQPPPDTKPN